MATFKIERAPNVTQEITQGPSWQKKRARKLQRLARRIERRNRK